MTGMPPGTQKIDTVSLGPWGAPLSCPLKLVHARKGQVAKDVPVKVPHQLPQLPDDRDQLAVGHPGVFCRGISEVYIVAISFETKPGFSKIGHGTMIK